MNFLEIIGVVWLPLNLINAIVMLFDCSPDEPIIIINWTVSELFRDKNLFGIVLSLLVCLLFVPSILLSCCIVAISRVSLLIGTVCEKIWNAGNKSKSLQKKS